MQPPQQHSWINLPDLKNQIIRKLGPERSKQYFDYLNKFLSLKLSKVEFDKLCVRTVGRDGIPLHNQLIRLILRNACTGKGPIGGKKPSDGVYHQNGSGPVVSPASSQLVLPNGDILSTSPRKARTGARDRRGGDRRSALGLNGKTNYSSPSTSVPHSDDFNTPLENGNISSPDTRRPVQHQEPTQQTGQKDGKGVLSGRIPLDAPLGIPYHPVSIGGVRRTPPISKSVGQSDINSLLDTITLRARMEPIAATEGLQGVSMDCANAVNNGLEAYLKGLIRSCSELNGSRPGSGSGNEPVKSSPAQYRPVNGIRPGQHYQMQEHEQKRTISLLDFRVAMELNPQQLGEEWPILLEKICVHAFKE